MPTIKQLNDIWDSEYEFPETNPLYHEPCEKKLQERDHHDFSGEIIGTLHYNETINKIIFITKE